MLFQRNPVMSAICLIANFFCIASLYLLLKAQFLAVIQVVVYTGAIMVLVIFVIMLLNLGEEQRRTEKLGAAKVLGFVLGLGFLAEMAYLFFASEGTTSGLSEQAEAIGSVEGMGAALFGKYLLPFEVTSLLLLAAVVGAVILAKKKI